MAGLLACPVFARPSRYIKATVAEFELQNENGLTAAGTAPVLHRIPFSDSLLQTKRFVTKNRFKSRKLSGINRTTLNVEQIETAEKKNCRQGGRQHQMPQL